MNKLRVMHVLYSLNVGGLERVVLNLAKGLKRQGHYVTICCLESKGQLGEEAECEGIKVYTCGTKSGLSWRLPFKIKKYIEEERVNLLHTHNEAGLIYGIPAAIMAGVKRRIHTEHGKEIEYYSKKAIKIAESLLFKKVRKVVTVSDDLKRWMVESQGVDSNKVHVIHNGIDIPAELTTERRAEIRNNLRLTSDSFVIGNIARLVALKNHKYLIRIVRILQQERDNIKLLLVGDGPLRHELERYSKELGVSNNVIFLGERKDAVKLLPAFDIFLLPSLTEGISMTILEAMAAGIPVIASNVGGNHEIIEHDKSGMLLSLDETSTWIKTIRYLMEHEQERKRLSDSARSRVVKEFSLETMVKRYEALYLN